MISFDVNFFPTSHFFGLGNRKSGIGANLANTADVAPIVFNTQTAQVLLM